MPNAGRAFCCALATVFGWALTGTNAGAQTDAVEKFYKGKTITLLVGSAAGGGYDALRGCWLNI